MNTSSGLLSTGDCLVKLTSTRSSKMGSAEVHPFQGVACAGTGLAVLDFVFPWDNKRTAIFAGE